MPSVIGKEQNIQNHCKSKAQYLGQVVATPNLFGVVFVAFCIYIEREVFYVGLKQMLCYQ